MALLLLTIIFTIILLTKPLLKYLNPTKYPPLNPLSNLTTLSYTYEHRHPFRTQRLCNQHLHHKHNHTHNHHIIRLSPTALSIADPRAIPAIYGHGTPCLKDDVYARTKGSHTHFNMLNTISRDDHSRKRRMLANAFSTKNLEQWEGKIVDKVERLVRQLDGRCMLPPSPEGMVVEEEGDVDLRFWLNLFTIDAIADIGLSIKLGLLDKGSDEVVVDDGEVVRYIECLHRGNRVSSWVIGADGWVGFLKGVSALVSPYLRRQWECGRMLGRVVRSLVQQRVRVYEEGGEEVSDFLGCLMEDKRGVERGLDRGEIEAEAGLLCSDTTAIALTNVMYYLIKNPHCLKKLREEVSSALSDNEVAPYAKVRNLPYLKACLEESLRLSPPVSRGLERKTPPEGMYILGERIPGNTTISVPTYAVHRDPDIFPDPEAFRPERWLEDEEQVKQMRAVFIPFSSGARACIGRNITFIEQQILVATLVHRYEFALPSKDWMLEWEEAFNLWPGRMPVKIWRRENKLIY